MADFGFIIHPLSVSDITKKFSITKKMPSKIVERGFRFCPSFKIASMEGIKSKSTGRVISGYFVVCPLTSRQILELPEDYVLSRIVKAGRTAEKAGAEIVGLGAMTSVVGDAGISIDRSLDIPVTTGNSYTIATAIEGTKRAASHMGMDISEAETVVIGATGSIGAVCAQLIAKDAKHLTLVARNTHKLDALARKIYDETGLIVRITDDLEGALQKAQVIITVTSSVGDIIEPEHLSPGSVVCDVARPRDVSKRVAEVRNDVLVIEGGLVKIPGDIKTSLNIGYPQDVAMACMAETMILALEDRCESYTLGRQITLDQVEEISRLAEKHGFELAGFRSFEKPIKEEEIYWIRRNAEKAKGWLAV